MRFSLHVFCDLRVMRCLLGPMRVRICTLFLRRKFLNYIWVSLKVETPSLSLRARKNHSCLQLTAGGQECRVHRVWLPAVKAASDIAKAAADAKWIITAWPYLMWTDGRSLMRLKGRNCGFTCLPGHFTKVVKSCFVEQNDLWRPWRSVTVCVSQYLCEWA